MHNMFGDYLSFLWDFFVAQQKGNHKEGIICMPPKVLGTQ
jgi:hypothetical protein